jgi:hypothetical protein
MTAISTHAPEEFQFPKEWALGAIAERLPPLPHEPRDGFQRKSRPLGYWYRLNYHMNHQPHKDLLETGLFEEHKLSFRLLYDWWTAQYQDPAFSISARCRELTHADIDLGGRPGTVEAVEIEQFIFRHLHLEQQSMAEPFLPPVAEHGQYHTSMLELFELELGFDSCYDPLNETSEMVDGRRVGRRDGAKDAYCQSVGWSIFGRYLVDGRVSKPCVTQPGEVGANQKSHLEKPLNAFLARGPILSPCPWIKEGTDEFKNMPYYLWDVQQGRTIKTAELTVQPEYVAISHTWGRWPTSYPIPVEGVPWKVPQNTRFRVDDVAHILSQVPGGLGYIWFDLVCIPQDGSDIGAREIARQAKIFRGAKYAIAWLNTIENLDGLFSGMAWKALHSLTFSINADKERQTAAIRSAWVMFSEHGSGLYLPRPDDRDFRKWSLNPWFTSLWTLQEICLRPDMWICVKDWSYLSSDGIIPITMGGFVAITKTDSAVVESQNDIAQQELIHWKFETGLEALLDLDPISIISLGDRRECLGRRAEAIMSVLGATEWYEGILRRKATLKEKIGEEMEKNLVFGKYPVEFVNELVLKMPGAFFAAFAKDEWFIDSETHSPLKKGSMLPFSKVQSVYHDSSPYRFLGYAAQPIASITSWFVQKDGTVRIPRATIISSKTFPDDVLSRIVAVQFFGGRDVSAVVAPLPADLPSCTGVPYKRDEWNDLHRWILRRTGEAYAVLTQFHHRIQGSTVVWTSLSGVILERYGSSPLRKTANFILYDELQAIDRSKADEVDWVVF